MRRLGIWYHPQRADSAEIAQLAVHFLADRRIEVWQGAADDEQGLARVAPDLDLLLTLGGDGTIVRAVRAVASARVPVLGVNLGRLGFLAEVEPPEVESALQAVLQGDFFVEERMMLRAAVVREGENLLTAEAVNEVVMARGLLSRTVRISVKVDGYHVMSPVADGVIVATPTGTTAYNLAAGGPIVGPDLRCLTITPIAAHLGIAPALVIPAHRMLSLRLIEGPGAHVSVDGQIDIAVETGDVLQATESQTKARFVRFGQDGHFYETVLRKLGWADKP